MKAAPRLYVCFVSLLFTACESLPESSRSSGFARGQEAVLVDDRSGDFDVLLVSVDGKKVYSGLSHQIPLAVGSHSLLLRGNPHTSADPASDTVSFVAEVGHVYELKTTVEPAPESRFPLAGSQKPWHAWVVDKSESEKKEPNQTLQPTPPSRRG